MTKDISIRDLIYFDFGKAASLFSQLEGGLPEKFSESYENIGAQDNKLQVNILNTLKAEYGEISSDKSSILETKVLHHDLLNKIEFYLNQAGMVCDLSKLEEQKTCDHQIIHEFIGGKSYIQAKGWSVFEDYSRIEDLTLNFNKLVEFLNRCNSGELGNKNNDAAQNQNKKAKKEKKKIINESLKEGQLPEWLFEGIRLWMKIFMKDRLNLRIVPFQNNPSMELLCNLKRDCFIDDDISHILYGYGVKPNKQLSVFGLITSTPPKDELEFDMFDQIEKTNAGDDKAAFETAFRNLFPALEGMESLATFHKFPRIILHPIAVFRDINGKLPIQK